MSMVIDGDGCYSQAWMCNEQIDATNMLQIPKEHRGIAGTITASGLNDFQSDFAGSYSDGCVPVVFVLELDEVFRIVALQER